MQNNIRTIIEAVSNTYGDDFFNSIVLALDKTIGADYTFIATLDDEKKSAKTIALAAKGKILDNFEYLLANTPCEDVAGDAVCYYRDQVCEAFPKDSLLKDMKIKAYIGAPLYSSKQEVMGIIVSLYKEAIEDNQAVETLFEVFSGRIAAELDRRNYQLSLEEQVLARTLKLSATIKQLQATQKQLVESDKMAALGSLVAGIAHEVNTPLGIAITTHSVIVDEHKKLNKKIIEQRLSMRDMSHYTQIVDNALNMQGENLTRAKKLIENFKKTAVDQHQLEQETINIFEYYQKVASTLNSILKTAQASLTITGDENLELTTYPGIHAQILTNFITNSVRHGFKESDNNQIFINIVKCNNGAEVQYRDNGVGLSDEAKKHVFEPFFTTARKSGGVGLGMSIVYNLITQKLRHNYVRFLFLIII